MSKHALHPPLFATFPILSLYAANLELVPLRHLWKPIAIAALLVCLVWLLLSLPLKGLRRGAVFASLLTICFLGYGHAHLAWESRIQPLGDELSIGLVGGITALAVALGIALVWNKDRLESATRSLNIAGLVLISVAGAGICSNWLKLAGVQAAPKYEFGRTELALGYAPDIFLIVLDGYARADVLKSHYGLDNSRFLNGLKERGFQVAEESRTNYVQTQLSIASMLNMDYLEQVADLAHVGTDRSVLSKPIRSGKVQQLLSSQGYVSISVGTGYSPVLPTDSLWKDRPSHRRTLFELMVLDLTPLGRGKEAMKSNYQAHYERIRGAFDRLRGLGPSSRAPRFVFAHILNPHPPFVLAADGSFSKPSIRFGLFDATHYMEVGGTKDSYREGYSKQILGLNKLLIDAIDRILEEATPPPVIILVSDHGPKMGYDQDDVSKTDLSEVVPNFIAVLAPADADFQLRADVTPVNLFRDVANSLLGTQFERLPDKSFYSPWEEPFRFAEVKP